MQTDYSTVAKLPEQEQLRLLECGDAPERLWAAWSLALRRGQGALPTLTELQVDALNEGLKRQLLVVLAGLGARNLLREIALDDPSINVRATALANYIRTSGPENTASTLSFTLELVDSGLPELVLTALLEHEANRLKLPERTLIACLSGRNDEVRLTAIHCLLGNSTVSSPARMAILQRLVDEQVDSLTKELLAYLPRAELPLLFDLLKTAPREPAMKLMGNLRKKFGTLTWDEVKPLSTVSEPLVVEAAVRLIQLPIPDEAIPWVSTVYRQLIPDSGATDSAARWSIGYALRRSLSEENVNLMPPETIRTLLQEVAEENVYFAAATPEEQELDIDFDSDAEDLARLTTILFAAIACE
ncbi:MAG: hypothetical protein QM784_17355 [Polyangiaceae bacterium]